MNTVLARLLPGHADGEAAAVRQQKDHRDVQQVTFPDLTWDHFHWEQQKRTGECDHPEAARRYRKTRAAFEGRHGEIIGEYWSIVEPSGVALTHKKVPLLLSPIIDDQRQFHRSTDWVTRHNPPLADVLFDCENLAIRISEVLRYTCESVGLKRIMAVASHTLGVIDRDGGHVDDAKATRIAAEENHELGDIRDYYRRAGARIGPRGLYDPHNFAQVAASLHAKVLEARFYYCRMPYYAVLTKPLGWLPFPNRVSFPVVGSML